MRVNTLLPHFTDCTFQFLNKAVQNQAVNRLKSAGEDFGHHQGGPRAGSWVLGWVSLPWAHHSQDPPGLKDSTDSESLMGTALATGHPAFSSLQPPQKLSTGSGGAWRMLSSPQHQTLVTQQGLRAARDTLQGCCGANPSLNTLLIHLHRSTGMAKEEKLSGQEGASMWRGRPSLSTQQGRGIRSLPNAARLCPTIPVTRECQHHARLSQGDKTCGLYLLGMAQSRLPRGSSTFTCY